MAAHHDPPDSARRFAGEWFKVGPRPAPAAGKRPARQPRAGGFQLERVGACLPVGRRRLLGAC